MGRPMLHDVCIVDGCNRPHRARGWCLPHYNHWYKKGAPGGGRIYDSYDPDEIPWCKCVEPDPYAGPLTLNRAVPLPGQCSRCGGPVYDALTASLAKGRAA